MPSSRALITVSVATLGLVGFLVYRNRRTPGILGFTTLGFSVRIRDGNKFDVQVPSTVDRLFIKQGEEVYVADIGKAPWSPDADRKMNIPAAKWRKMVQNPANFDLWYASGNLVTKAGPLRSLV